MLASPVYIPPPAKRDLPPGIQNRPMIQLDDSNFRSCPLATQFDQRLAPGRDDHAVPVASTLFVVLADLRSSDDIGLGFDGPGPQEDRPVCLARWDGECAGIRNDVRRRVRLHQPKGRFRETQLTGQTNE